MLATLLLALTLFTSTSFSTAVQSNTTNPEITIVVPEAVDPCGDSFSGPVRNDLTGYINEDKASVILSPFFGEDITVFQSRGYCQPLDEAGTKMNTTELAASIIAELTAEAELNNHKVTYVSNVIPVLGGNMVATVVAPPIENLTAAGVDYRIFTVFIFNKTRIVGFQSFVSVTGLKTP